MERQILWIKAGVEAEMGEQRNQKGRPSAARPGDDDVFLHHDSVDNTLPTPIMNRPPLPITCRSSTSRGQSKALGDRSEAVLGRENFAHPLSA